MDNHQASAMPTNIFKQLTDLLDQHQACYRIMLHAPAGRSEQVAAIRGTQIGQGAKGLVCHIKGRGAGSYALAILPADKQADLNKLAAALGGSRASLASPVEVMALTQCVFGAIPPFSFHPDLQLVADPLLFERYCELAFNAGSLGCSIILNTEDYQRIAQPTLISFIQSC